MNEYNYILKQMIEKYDIYDFLSAKNAIKEIMQEITLCGLARSDFFHEVAFYGGTCLRIFYGLKRFSEDLDFTQNMPYNYKFDLKKYKSYIDNEFQSLGLNAYFEVSEKAEDNEIKRGYIKGNTIDIFNAFSIDKNILSEINHNDVIKVKLEVDSNPAVFALYDMKFGLLPSPYAVRTYDIESLFASKISAVVCRGWKNRFKGRDLYDFYFYIKNNVKVNLICAESRIKKDDMNIDSRITLDDLKMMLCEKFDTIDYEKAKRDAMDFVANKNELDIWSADFFKSITQKIEESENHILVLCSDKEIENYVPRNDEY